MRTLSILTLLIGGNLWAQGVPAPKFTEELPRPQFTERIPAPKFQSAPVETVTQTPTLVCGPDGCSSFGAGTIVYPAVQSVYTPRYGPIPPQAGLAPFGAVPMAYGPFNAVQMPTANNCPPGMFPTAGGG